MSNLLDFIFQPEGNKGNRSRVICPECDGKGKVECEFCGGKSWDCPVCDGDGVYTCPECHGRGYIYKNNY